ncbi:MAG: hypothetical protein IT581_23175 [Verrucomicrobiales bacterium]|nr:hypothetical protein [Verrucomicrobiales bacterium]
MRELLLKGLGFGLEPREEGEVALAGAQDVGVGELLKLGDFVTEGDPAFEFGLKLFAAVGDAAGVGLDAGAEVTKKVLGGGRQSRGLRAYSHLLEDQRVENASSTLGGAGLEIQHVIGFAEVGPVVVTFRRKNRAPEADRRELAASEIDKVFAF